jgi:hypothetical protein
LKTGGDRKEDGGENIWTEKHETEDLQKLHSSPNVIGKINLWKILCMKCSNVRKKSNVRYGGFTAVTMKNAVFWDVIPCGSCKSRRFGGMYLHHQGDTNRRARNNVGKN